MSVSVSHRFGVHAPLLPPLMLLAWWAASAKPFLYAPYHAVSVFAAEHLGGWAARLFPLALPEAWRPQADSWGPMFHAHAERAASGRPHEVFFGRGIRFQYPPLSLLLVSPFAGAGTDTFAFAMNVGTALAHGGIAATAGVLARSAWRRRRRAKGGALLEEAAVFLAATAFGLLFRPPVIGTALGQVQTALTLAVMVAMLLVQRGASTPAFVILAGTCVFKPMLAPSVVWPLLAGWTRPALAFLVTGAALAALSVAGFGISSHLDYMRVLQILGGASESFLANSAPAGILSRRLGNPFEWHQHYLGTYSAAVHATGLATTVVLGVIGMLTGRFAMHDPALALATAIAAFSLASPIVWDHHYSFFLPLAVLSFVALVLPADGAHTRRSLPRACLWTCGTTLTTCMPRPRVLLRLSPPLAEAIAALPFLGGLCLVWLGWSLLAEARRASSALAEAARTGAAGAAT